MIKGIENGFGGYEPHENLQKDPEDSIDVPETQGTEGNPDVLVNMPTKEKPFDPAQLGEPDREGIRRLIEKMQNRPSDQNDD